MKQQKNKTFWSLDVKPRISWLMKVTLWLFNIAMENDPFIDDFPIKTSIYKGFSMATLNNQMVYHWIGLCTFHNL
jgi:hypothetical protein